MVGLYGMVLNEVRWDGMELLGFGIKWVLGQDGIWDGVWNGSGVLG